MEGGASWHPAFPLLLPWLIGLKRKLNNPAAKKPVSVSPLLAPSLVKTAQWRIDLTLLLEAKKAVAVNASLSPRKCQQGQQRS